MGSMSSARLGDFLGIAPLMDIFRPETIGAVSPNKLPDLAELIWDSTNFSDDGFIRCTAQDTKYSQNWIFLNGMRNNVISRVVHWHLLVWKSTRCTQSTNEDGDESRQFLWKKYDHAIVAWICLAQIDNAVHEASKHCIPNVQFMSVLVPSALEAGRFSVRFCRMLVSLCTPRQFGNLLDLRMQVHWLWLSALISWWTQIFQVWFQTCEILRWPSSFDMQPMLWCGILFPENACWMNLVALSWSSMSCPWLYSAHLPRQNPASFTHYHWQIGVVV